MTKSRSLDSWRDFFRSANSDIFNIIDHAIMVAASDCPKELRLRRARIAELLFSCRMAPCSSCDRVELAVPVQGAAATDGFVDEGVGSKESKANSDRDDHGEQDTNPVDNYSYGDAEALSDEIEKENQTAEEILRIKEILLNSRNVPDSDIFDSLRRLQLMTISVDILTTTEIGKAVNRLRKHQSEEIRLLARTLIQEWKYLVDEWVNATKAIAESTPESVNPSVVEEEEGEGLPIIPLDEGAFFATQPMELSQFFDGMDDDGNPRNTGESKKDENRRKSSRDDQNIMRQNQPRQPNILAKDKCQPMKNQEAIARPSKPSHPYSRPERSPETSAQKKNGNETKPQQVKDSIQRKPVPIQQNNLKCSDEVAVQRKLEATKRRLQESYQQAENAKKQRTIQVMELHDLPKQGLAGRNNLTKPGNQNRSWGHGRR